MVRTTWNSPFRLITRSLAEPSTVVGDDPVTRSQQDRGLLLPRSTAQRIPMDQHCRPTGTVILILKIDVARIFLTDVNVRHKKLPLFLFDVDDYRLRNLLVCIL
jgi:hypothetical protein